MAMDRKIIRDLKAHATAENREVLKRFFKTGKGEYGLMKNTPLTSWCHI